MAEAIFNLADLARTGRLFHGGVNLVANGIAPVADFPTTTAGLAVYNGNIGTKKCLLIDQVCFSLASGTAAAGASLVGAVTSQSVADAQRPTANGTGLGNGSMRGMSDNSQAWWKASLTIPAGANWFLIGASLQLATADLGQGKGPWPVMMLVPPTYAACFSIISGTGTSPKYSISARFGVIELDLSP
jgi:hypothetical protein